MTNPFRYALLTVLKLADLAVVGTAFALAVVIEMQPQPWLSVLEMRIELQNALFVLVPGQRTIAVIGLATKRRLGQVDVGFEPRVVALAGERR